MPLTVQQQACVIAIRRARLSSQIKNEMRKFISRNILQDCERVSPHCLKAHLIRTGKKLKLNSGRLATLKNLFKARIGFKGYYLDNGKLKKV